MVDLDLPSPPGGQRAADEDRSILRELLAELGRGLQSGLVATFVMTAFRLPIMRSLPPSAHFWAKYVGNGKPEDYPVIGLLLHLVYGGTAGAAFAVGFAHLDAERSLEPELRGVLWGSAYGLALSVFGSQVMLEELLDIQLETDELTLFHAAHVVYGISLGAWTGSRLEGTSDPDEDYQYDEDESGA